MRSLVAATAIVSFAFVASPSHAARDDGMPSWNVPATKQTAQRKSIGKRGSVRGHRVKRARVAARRTSVRRAASRRPAVVEVAPVMVRTPFGTNTQTIASRAGVPSEIAQFLSRVQSQCGAVRITSAYRPGSRIGSGRLSCHALGRAVDYQVANPACALRVANSGWRGGHSIDYYTAPGGRHFHVSNCAQEAGIRFAHRGGGTRYARRAALRRHAGRSYQRHAGKRYAMIYRGRR